MVAEQLRQIDQQPSAILLEPVGRNTAPAVALAALQALKVDTKATLLILPADHSIAHPEALCDAIKALSDHVEQGMLATFGIVPTCPETGYGYIQKGTSIQTSPAACFHH